MSSELVHYHREQRWNLGKPDLQRGRHTRRAVGIPEKARKSKVTRRAKGVSFGVSREVLL